MLPVVLGAQEREARGQLRRASLTSSVPVARVWVTLHRVGKDGAGPLDSVRTDADGRYRFRFRARGDPAALYFASSSHGGIAYFTPPFKKARILGGEGDLFVYDTTSGPVPIHVRGRHLVIAAPDSGRARTVFEVFDLSNDSTLTRVAAARDGTTFETILPDGAREPRVGDGDITPEAISFANGRVRVAAPIAPGVKQLTFNYRLPLGGDAMAFVILEPTAVLEVMIEDQRGTAVGAGLRESMPVVVEGRNFRRFLAQDITANGVVRVTAPTRLGGVSSVQTAVIVTAVGAGLLVVVASIAYRRGPLTSRRRAAAAGDPDALARQIATLDAAFETNPSPTADDRADHYEMRARLKAQLTAALAARDGLA